MSEIKSIADQLRSKVGQSPESGTPAGKGRSKQAETPAPEKHAPSPVSEIIQILRAYDNTDHKSMVHARFDTATAQTLTHFKLATGIEVTRVVAYAVGQFIKEHPEIRDIIKHYFKNLEL
jgi:hypothetical protein